MAEENIVERAIVPHNPSTNRVVNNNQYNLYAPVAGVGKVGMAGYKQSDFDVDNGQTVSISATFKATFRAEINAETDDKLADKVDKEAGKGLSTNDLTNTLKTAYDEAVNKKHEHSNKAILDSTNAAFTTTLKTGYDDANTKKHTHSNKITLDATTASYTTDEKSKLATLENSHFRGQYLSKTALDSAVPSGNVGDYAYVDSGAGFLVQKYLWDSSDNVWVPAASEGGEETPASIKHKYESNPDTNAYTNAEKTKVANLKTQYDKIITTSSDFHELLASPTWLDAVSVAFIGEYLVYSEIIIPNTVKRIDGFNATITFINFNADSTGLLRYDNQPVDHDCSISGITIYCSRAPIESWEIYGEAKIVAFANFRNITNCKASFVGEGSFIAFKNCDVGGNLYAKNLRNSETTGILNCTSRLYVDCTNMHDCYGDAYSFGQGYGGPPVDWGVYYEGFATIFLSCENMTNIGGTSIAETGVDSPSAFNAAECCHDCNNINNVKATVTGTNAYDYACGLASCQNASNINIEVKCFGDYGYAIGVYDSYNISSCNVNVTVPVGSERQAYDYYDIRRASNCYPLLSSGNWGGILTAIDPSAGGDYITGNSAVTGVKGDAEETYRIGNVNITPTNIGLGNVDNTSDAEKPVSTAQQTAINTAVLTASWAGAITIGVEATDLNTLIEDGRKWRATTALAANCSNKPDTSPNGFVLECVDMRRSDTPYRTKMQTYRSNNGTWYRIGSQATSADAVTWGAWSNIIVSTGAQTIGGAKTFTDNITLSKASPYIFLKHSTDEYNVTPSSNLFSGIEIMDKNGVYTGGFRGFRSVDGSTYAHIVARNQSNATVSTGLRGYADGTWTFLPSTNNLVDIGAGTARYKDLYLAGNINAAGTITGNVVNSPYKLIASGTLAANASLTLNSLIFGNNLNGRKLYLRIYGNDIAGGQFRLNNNRGIHLVRSMFFPTYSRTDKTADDTEYENYSTFGEGELIEFYFLTEEVAGQQFSAIQGIQSSMNIITDMNIDYQKISLQTTKGQIPTLTFYNADTNNPINYQLYAANY